MDFGTTLFAELNTSLQVLLAYRRILFVKSSPLRSRDIRDKVRNGILALFGDQLYFSATKQRLTRDAGPKPHIVWFSWIRRALRALDLLPREAPPRSFAGEQI